MNDFLFKSANSRLGIIDAAQRRLGADLAEAQQYGNTTEAGEIIQQMANLEAEKRNMQQLKDDYMRGQQPNDEEVSEAEFMAMTPKQMKRHPQAGALVDRIFSKSKYYTPDQWSDPKVQKGVRDGLAEVDRRNAEERSRGN